MKKLLLFPTAAITALILLNGRGSIDAKPDAISAASITVAASSITSTSAIIKYSADKYDYGTRTLCYDPSPNAPTHNCTTKNASGNSGSFTISGLKSGTKYNYNVKAVDTRGGEKPYSTTGNFTTLAATGILAPIRAEIAVPGTAPVFDLRGRSLPTGAATPGVTTVTLPAAKPSKP